MDIFESRYYRFNSRMLKFISQWPYQEPKTHRIRQTLFHTSIMTVILTQIWGDMDVMIECLTPMVSQLNACVKSLNCIMNRDKMKTLLETIKRDWSNLRHKDEIKILTRYAEQGRKLTLIYTVYMYGTLVVYLSIPLMPRILDVIIPLNESRQRTYLYQTQYFVDPEEYFYPIMLHTYLATVITVLTSTAVDAMFASYVQHVCGILAIVGHRIENLMETQDANLDRWKGDDKGYRELMRCIDQHSEALEFAGLIENSHSTAILIQFGMSVALMSISGVQILAKFGQYEEMIRLFVYGTAQILHVLVKSWPGQQLLDQSVSLRDSVYFTEWYSLSTRGKMLLRIVMLRTLNPLKITVGKLFDLSMENFGVMIRTSVSYFTVFASLR